MVMKKFTFHAVKKIMVLLSILWKYVFFSFFPNHVSILQFNLITLFF